MLVVACERGAKQRGGEIDSAAATSARIDTVPAQRPLESVVTSRDQPPCPATGNWAECSVFERLDRAGLAPRKDSAGVTEPPLTARGILMRVGNSELELYMYPDLAARERDEATLDQAKYADHSKPLTMRPLPTLIPSANLIAILHSRNEHLRERVSDAITAGPPQPSRP